MILNLRNNGKINKMIWFFEDFAPPPGFVLIFLTKRPRLLENRSSAFWKGFQPMKGRWIPDFYPHDR
jgi:hypothetical protein